jgi:hypothetical protein
MVSTTTPYSAPTSAFTIKALEERKAELEKRAAEATAPQQIISPWQGAAQMANAFTVGLKEHQAAQQAAAGRQQLSELMKDGITPEEIPQIYALDEALGRFGMEQQASDARFNREMEIKDSDYKRSRADSAADRAAERAAQNEDAIAREKRAAELEATTNARELEEQKAAELRKAKEEADTNARELKEEQERLAAAAKAEAIKTAFANQREENMEARKTMEKNQRESGQKALEREQKLKDEAGKAQSSLGQLTSDFKKGLITEEQYREGLEVLKKQGTITIPPVPSETGAKVALGELYQQNAPVVEAAVAAGDMTGPWDIIASQYLGRGPGADPYNKLLQGTEALVRQLTGAGMQLAEAKRNASQYEPSFFDTPETMADKLKNLSAALGATAAGATQGRQDIVIPGEEQPAAQSEIVEITTKEEHAKLPPGTRYKYQGQISTKK